MTDLNPYEESLAIELKAARGSEMTDRRQIADELWAAFKGWEGERKYALRQIVKHLKAGDENEQLLAKATKVLQS